MYWNSENRGEILNLWLITKKRSSEILADENRQISGKKVKFGKVYTESEIFRKQRGNLKQGQYASLPQRGWTPLTSMVHWDFVCPLLMEPVLSPEKEGGFSLIFSIISPYSRSTQAQRSFILSSSWRPFYIHFPNSTWSWVFITWSVLLRAGTLCVHFKLGFVRPFLLPIECLL